MERGAWVWGNAFLLEEGRDQHATEKWQGAAGEGGTLCSVHRHVNGTLFMSRQRGRKVTGTHARMPLCSSSRCSRQERGNMVGWRRGLFGSIRQSIEMTRVRKLGFDIN